MGKRGKRPQAGKRERNGRLSRQPQHVVERNMEGLDREQRETLAIGLEARERIWGVKPSHSRDQKAGSAVGRYCLQGLITQAQYDAAMQFVESYHRHLRAIDAPPQPGAVDLNATRGRPVFVENADQLRKWRSEHKAAMDAIQVKQNEIRLMGNIYGAIYAVLFRDVMLETLLGDLRVGLNALVRHYGLSAKVAA